MLCVLQNSELTDDIVIERIGPVFLWPRLRHNKNYRIQIKPYEEQRSALFFYLTSIRNNTTSSKMKTKGIFIFSNLLTMMYESEWTSVKFEIPSS